MLKKIIILLALVNITACAAFEGKNLWNRGTADSEATVPVNPLNNDVKVKPVNKKL